MESRRVTRLKGAITVPGDKSISHRALMLAALSVGETRIRGLLEGEDVLRTAEALRALGCRVENEGGVWRVSGRGVGGLAEPDTVLDMGNSGTAARLLMGVLAAHPMTAVFTGDGSLNDRPMGRVTEPLRRMGARFTCRSGGRLPITLTGTERPLPIEYESPVASAQVKSAVLLAGLNAPGRTTVIEPRPTRDHTERMLRHFGAEVRETDLPGGGREITLTGQPELEACDIIVPGDFSSAAFPLVAALLVPGSLVTVKGLGVNSGRRGLLDTLMEMGADITLTDERVEAGEPVADITAKTSRLKGVDVPPERAPSMIDEYPVLAMAAACATGTTTMAGIAELRVKESDRIAAVAKGLELCGAGVREEADQLTVTGSGAPPRGGGTVAVRLDHRIAMSFLVLGMATDEPVRIDDAGPIETSFPGFQDLMNGLGASIEGRSTGPNGPAS